MTTAADHRNLAAIDLACQCELAGTVPSDKLARRLHAELVEMHKKFRARAVADGVSAEEADEFWRTVLVAMLGRPGGTLH